MHFSASQAAGRKEKASTGEQINLADVRGSSIYTKTGQIIQLIKVEPISTALMSDLEKADFTTRMTRELSPLRLPFKLLFLTRPTDVRRTIDYYEETKANTVSTKKRDNLTKMITYFPSMVSTGGVLERQTYVMLWMNSGHSPEELQTKSSEFLRALENSSITAHLCTQQELVTVLSLFYRPMDTAALSLEPGITPDYIQLEGERLNG